MEITHLGLENSFFSSFLLLHGSIPARQFLLLLFFLRGETSRTTSPKLSSEITVMWQRSLRKFSCVRGSVYRHTL